MCQHIPTMRDPTSPARIRRREEPPLPWTRRGTCTGLIVRLCDEVLARVRRVSVPFFLTDPSASSDPLHRDLARSHAAEYDVVSRRSTAPCSACCLLQRVAHAPWLLSDADRDVHPKKHRARGFSGTNVCDTAGHSLLLTLHNGRSRCLSEESLSALAVNSGSG